MAVSRSARTTLPAEAREPTFFFEHDLPGLLQKAVEGERGAWDRIVEVFGGMIRSIARAQGLSSADAADVSQTIWLRFLEHLDRIEQPERVGGWLATSTRRECARLRKERRTKAVVADNVDLDRMGSPEAGPDAQLLAGELAREVTAAYGRLPIHCKAMIGLLAAEPPTSYRELSELLDMPFGSIGPTRRRCIECMRRLIESAPGGTISPDRAPRTAPGRSGMRHTA